MLLKTNADRKLRQFWVSRLLELEVLSASDSIVLLIQSRWSNPAGTLTAVKCLKDVFPPQTTPYTIVAGGKFIVMNDDARLQLAGFVAEYLEHERL
ncbi:hypothetical protein TNIN_166671 [Trichonephila inaurata madagascariensis]|uniref:Uncharacterized protein n=1 Tax=Trichonephila inaurata madagascariensis TaxID=2747483 RepID=A0A8X6WNV5_9ARAC|nr:hypothetical protein TNIN_166671 [Trichonephila inaurata madagascariensis]